LKFRTFVALGSPTVADMRTFFRVKWAVRVVNRGPNGILLEIDWSKMAENYPFLEGANLLLTAENVNSPQEKKRKKSRAEQATIYRKLLKSGIVKNKAELARMFGVSRAWVTKVLK